MWLWYSCHYTCVRTLVTTSGVRLSVLCISLDADQFVASCSFGSLVDRESVYLKVTVCLDVISDALGI